MMCRIRIAALPLTKLFLHSELKTVYQVPRWCYIPQGLVDFADLTVEACSWFYDTQSHCLRAQFVEPSVSDFRIKWRNERILSPWGDSIYPQPKKNHDMYHLPQLRSEGIQCTIAAVSRCTKKIQPSALHFNSKDFPKLTYTCTNQPSPTLLINFTIQCCAAFDMPLLVQNQRIIRTLTCRFPRTVLSVHCVHHGAIVPSRQSRPRG